MRILVDFDQTIVPSSEVIFEVYKQETGYEGEYNPNHSWNFEGLLPKEYVPREINLFCEKVFYDNLKPFPNAIRVLEELSKDNEVIIVTKHNVKGREYKTKWVEDNLPFAKLVYTETFDKSCVEGSILIDDKLECLESVKDSVKYRICYGNYMWNTEWDGTRCLDWLSVKEELTNII